MAKTTNQTTLDRKINDIVSAAAKAIADVLKQSGAATPKAPPAAPAPAAPAAPAKAKRGRPAKSAAPAPAAGGRKPHPRRSYTDSDIERVENLIASKPGLRSEHIKAAIGGDDRAVEKILERLRQAGRVKTTGIKRAMTYSIAGAAAPKAAKPAKAAKKAPKVAAPEAAPAAAPAPAAPAAPAKRGRKSPKTGDILDQVLAVIRGEAGLRSEQITKRVGQSADAVKAALAKLRTAGKVKTAGVARGTSYTAV